MQPGLSLPGCEKRRRRAAGRRARGGRRASRPDRRRRPGLVAMAAFATALAAVAAVVAAPGQRSVDERRPVRGDADVEIFNLAGSLRVVGWEADEVHVTGTLGPDVERLDIEIDGGDIEIRAAPRSRRARRVGGERYAAELEVRVPRRASLEIETAAATLSVEGVEGALSLESISGTVTVSGGPRTVEVVTTNGEVRLTLEAGTREVDVETVSGAVTIRGGGEVAVTTMSGDVRVGGAVAEAELSSVAGGVYLDLEPIGRGRYEIENFSGDVEVTVGGAVSAGFEISTYSGPIDDDFGHQPRRTATYTPQQELEFELGDGRGASVTVETFSGRVRIRRR